MSHPVLFRWAVAALVPLAVLAVPAPASAAPVPATAVDLGGLGGDQTFPAAINAVGQVAGQSRTAAGEYHAFFWSRGRTIDLGIAPGGTFSLVTGLNDRGQVTGYGDTADGSAAFVWRAGVRTELPSPGIGQARTAGINAAGTVIGSDVDAASGQPRGFLWRDGRFTDLGPLQPALINDAGVVVGTVPAADGADRVVRWQRGVRTDLGPLGVPGSGRPYLADLNRRGDLAAYASTGTGYRAYVRPAGATGWRPLPGLPGATDVRVSALTERGVAVGTSDTGPGTPQRAVRWTGGAAYALPTLGGGTSAAVDVNDRGDVSGFSVTPAGEAHAVAWRRGVLVDLGPAGADSGAGAINQAGQLIGSAATPDERVRGLRWTLAG